MKEGGAGGSWLAVEASFDVQASDFVERLRACREPSSLGAFARRWLQDPRPWARREMLRYVDAPMDRDGHHALVKRLFKGAEERHDVELMGAFMAAFDRLVRRRRVRKTHFEWPERIAVQREVLETPHDTLHPGVERQGGKWVRRPTPPPGKRARRLFTHHTRNHLRRRAWRYFRRLGFRDPAAHVAAVAGALLLYREEDLAAPEHLLDSHALLHAAFGRSPALDLSRPHPRLREGRTMRDVLPAPAFEPAWAATGACDELLRVLHAARARVVRTWAYELLRRHHATHLAERGVAVLVELATSESAEARQLFAEVLASARGLEALPVEGWLGLVTLADPVVAAAACDAFRKHVAPSRVSAAQAVTLAISRAAPAARLGLDLLRDRVPGAGEAGLWNRLAGARCAAHAREAGQIGLAVAGAPPADRDAVTLFFDAAESGVRSAAMDWLAEEGNAHAADPVLWARIMETPYDEVRLRAVDLLQDRDFLRRAAGEVMIPAWIAVLLGVHRGGRQKLRATQQVRDAVLAEPARAGALLPVLAVAARSPRAPESRAALAALVTLSLASPDLAEAVARHVPELEIAPVTA